MLDRLFRPTCPCDPAAKAWVESRLQWLAGQFEHGAFTGRPIILPTPEYFPDLYDGSRKSAWLLLKRVCQYMEVDPNRIALRFISDGARLYLVNENGLGLYEAAGTYEDGGDKLVIRIDEAELSQPMDLVGTMAHELAHVRLLDERRITKDEFDHELLTDLTALHLGLGIFLANSPRNWECDYTKWPGTNLLKPEYMTPPMFGWALAHLAWFCGDDRLAWVRHLTDAARTNLKQGLRYLRKTGDSSYRPM